jgi:hypothetical protein
MSNSDKNNRRAVLYLRVASNNQHTQRNGIAQQRAVCTREAERLGVVVIDEFIDTEIRRNA